MDPKTRPAVPGKGIQIDQAEYETLQLGHKYKKAGNADGDMLINSVRSKAAKDKFNQVHGTSY